MLTPLFFRRLLFVLEWAAFGGWLSQHGLAAGLLAALSLAAAVAQRVLRRLYGPAVEPLLPPVISRPLAYLGALPGRGWAALATRAGRVWAGLATRAGRIRAGLAQLPTGTRALLHGALAVAVFMLLPPLVRLVYPRFGGFPPDTINAYTLGAMQFFLALTVAFVAWRWLFPQLYAYAVESLEGKLLDGLTADLLARLPTNYQLGQEERLRLRLAALAERRKIATLTFCIRCARFVFSTSPFFLFLLLANAALTAALTVVP